MLTKYYTIKEAGSHVLYIQKSRFIGYVERVHSEDEAHAFINRIKKKHYDATHNCSAYIIGDHDEIQKANDDGEPGGTAGIPMLEVLKKLPLKNSAVVVTRYFGGIKLGAGGLIRAYGTTTAETIKKTGIVKCELVQGVSLVVEYPLLGKLENHLRNSHYILEDIHYLDLVELIVYVPIDEVQTFKTEMINLTSDQVTMKLLEKKHVETTVPYK